MAASKTRRSLTAFFVVVWLTVYVTGAWIVGWALIPEHWLWQLIYFPVAGLLWVPVAISIMKWGARQDD